MIRPVWTLLVLSSVCGCIANPSKSGTGSDNALLIHMAPHMVAPNSVVISGIPGVPPGRCVAPVRARVVDAHGRLWPDLIDFAPNDVWFSIPGSAKEAASYLVFVDSAVSLLQHRVATTDDRTVHFAEAMIAFFKNEKEYEKLISAARELERADTLTPADRHHARMTLSYALLYSEHAADIQEAAAFYAARAEDSSFSVGDRVTAAYYFYVAARKLENENAIRRAEAVAADASRSIPGYPVLTPERLRQIANVTQP